MYTSLNLTLFHIPSKANNDYEWNIPYERTFLESLVKTSLCLLSPQADSLVLSAAA